MRRSMIAAVAAAAVVVAVICAGRYAREALKERQRYSVHFADVQCDSPPGMDRATFLAEVQYLGNLPDSIYVLDPEAAKHVEVAFTRHPWVARVLGTDLAAKGPSVVVRLVLRRPVLVVAGRTVDEHGVLLPAGAPTAGLPVYAKAAPPPKGPAGTPWGDPDVEAAAWAAAPHPY